VDLVRSGHKIETKAQRHVRIRRRVPPQACAKSGRSLAHLRPGHCDPEGGPGAPEAQRAAPEGERGSGPAVLRPLIHPPPAAQAGGTGSFRHLPNGPQGWHRGGREPYLPLAAPQLLLQHPGGQGQRATGRDLLVRPL